MFLFKSRKQKLKEYYMGIILNGIIINDDLFNRIIEQSISTGEKPENTIAGLCHEQAEALINYKKGV